MSRPRWAGVFEDLPREHGFEALEVEGTLPAALTGTLWVNGPGRWRWPGYQSRFWLDADGAVTALRLGGGRAEGAARLVQTRSVRREREAGRLLYSRYDRRSPRLLREMWLGDSRNSGNTSVWARGDRRYALCPEGVPVEIDPDTLETRGEEDFGGLLAPGFSAHASHHWARGTDYNFALRAGRRSFIDLFAFPRAGAPHRLTSFEIRRPCFVHDFMVTDRWAVFLLPPFHIQPLPLVLGLRPFSGCLAWEPEQGAEVVLVGLDAPHEVVRFTVPAMAVLHWANAWEERGRVIAQASVIEDMPRTWRWLEGLAALDARPIPDARMSRIEIDPVAKTLRHEPLTDEVGEQPRIDPFREQRPSRFVHHTAFGASAGLHDRIVRLDVERGRSEDVHFGDDVFPSEPIFVARGGARGAEDDGWLLSVVFDPRSGRSGLAIADAQRPGDRVIATAWLDHHVPLPFHGTWVGIGDRASDAGAPTH